MQFVLCASVGESTGVGNEKACEPWEGDGIELEEKFGYDSDAYMMV